MLPFQTPVQLNLKLVVAGSSLKAPFLFKLFDKPKGREHAHELDYIPLNQAESIVVLCVLSCIVVLCLSFLCLACSLLCHLRRHVCFSYFYHLYLVFFFFMNQMFEESIRIMNAKNTRTVIHCSQKSDAVTQSNNTQPFD